MSSYYDPVFPDFANDSFYNFEGHGRNALVAVPCNLYDIFLDCIRDESNGKVSFRILNDAMKEIHTKYSAIGLKEANALNYERVELRCGYVYLYCTSHVRMVQQAFEDLSYRKPAFLPELIDQRVASNGQLNLCSIGGGPGSDVVGAMLFLKQFDILDRYPIKINLIDGYPEWASTFSTIMRNFNQHELFSSTNSAKVTFQDLLKGLSKFTKCVISKAHVITMVKFVSAVCGNIEKAGTLLRSIFNTMSCGAMIMIIDNAGGPGFTYAQKVAENCGLKAIVSPRTHFRFEVDQFLEPNIQMREFDKPAQRAGTVSIAFMEKTNDMADRGAKRPQNDDNEGPIIQMKKRKLNISPPRVNNETKDFDDDSENNKLDESFKCYNPYRTPSKRSQLIEKTDQDCGKIVLSHTPRRSTTKTKNTTPKKTFKLKPMKFTPRFHEHRRRCRKAKRRSTLKPNRRQATQSNPQPQGYNFDIAGQYPNNFHFGSQPLDQIVQFGSDYTQIQPTDQIAQFNSDYTQIQPTDQIVQFNSDYTQIQPTNQRVEFHSDYTQIQPTVQFNSVYNPFQPTERIVQFHSDYTQFHPVVQFNSGCIQF